MRPFLLAAVVSAGLTPAASAHTLDDVKQAWRAREQSLRSVRMAWTATRLYRPGSIDSPELARALGTRRGRALEVGVPTRDVQFTIPVQLLLRGDWMRYTNSNLSISQTGDLSLVPYESGYDGQESRTLFSDRDNGPYRGTIRDEQRNTDAPIDSLKAVMLWARPLNPIFQALHLDTLSIERESGSIDGLPVLAVRDKRTRVSVDPERAYLPLKWDDLRDDGSIDSSLRIEYAEHKDAGWVPSAWTYEADFTESGPLMTSAVTVDIGSVQVNPDLPRSAFQVDFPPGTVVYVQKSREELVVDRDGVPRPKELGATERPAAPRKWKGLLIANAIGLVVVVLVWIVARSRVSG